LLARVCAAALAAIFFRQLPPIQRFFGLDRLPPAVLAQLIVFAVAGIAVIALSLLELRHGREADALLLSLGVLGTFVFAAAFQLDG